MPSLRSRIFSTDDVPTVRGALFARGAGRAAPAGAGANTTACVPKSFVAPARVVSSRR